MEIKPTLDGLDLCLRNSLRLFEDSCTDGLSLPTVGAILEIGLEEAAKAILILICLEKKDRVLPKMPITLDESLSGLKDIVGNFFDNINCQEQLTSAFRKHEVKTEILNFFGSIANLVPPESPSMKDLTKHFLRDYDPNLKDDVLEKQYSSPTVIDSINRKMNALGSVLKEVSGRTKESGFYVDWTGSGFKYPEINNSTIRQMADFLVDVIIGIKRFTELLQIKLQTELDVHYLYQKLAALEGRLK
jgi:hypothetical protein